MAAGRACGRTDRGVKERAAYSRQVAADPDRRKLHSPGCSPTGWNDGPVTRVPFFGDTVWHHHWSSAGLSVLLAMGSSAFVAWVALGGDAPAWWWLVCVAPPFLVWICVLRPRVVIADSEIVVVKWFRTLRRPLRDLVGARPGYFGTELMFAVGGSVVAGTLQRPNWAAWLGKLSRADKVAHRLLCRAALSRGEPPPSISSPRRSVGDLRAGLGAALGVLIAALFGSS